MYNTKVIRVIHITIPQLKLKDKNTILSFYLKKDAKQSIRHDPSGFG
jgi:hypothetical protein